MQNRSSILHVCGYYSFACMVYLYYGIVIITDICVTWDLVNLWGILNLTVHLNYLITDVKHQSNFKRIINGKFFQQCLYQVSLYLFVSWELMVKHYKVSFMTYGVNKFLKTSIALLSISACQKRPIMSSFAWISSTANPKKVQFQPVQKITCKIYS